MSVQDVENRQHTADERGRRTDRPLTRRRFALGSASAAVILSGSLAACGKRGDLKPPPVEAEQPTETDPAPTGEDIVK